MPPDRRHTTLNPRIAMRSLALDDDIATLHRWFLMDYAHYWNMQHLSLTETRQFYADMQSASGTSAYLGLYDGRAAFVAEYYDPAHDPLGRYYPTRVADLGMHFLVGPRIPHGPPIPRFTRDILRHVMTFAFDTLGAQRVVVEPDVRNHKVHRLNRAVGFRYDRQILLPHKTAWLAFCTRSDFARSTSGDDIDECTL